MNRRISCIERFARTMIPLDMIPASLETLGLAQVTLDMACMALKNYIVCFPVCRILLKIMGAAWHYFSLASSRFGTKVL